MICSEPLAITSTSDNDNYATSTGIDLAQIVAITSTSTSENDNYATSMGINLAQKFGALAIGETVCRIFGEHGIFYGVIKAYRKEGKQELYTVEYSDGDAEDLDEKEYNYAYALWLKKEG